MKTSIPTCIAMAALTFAAIPNESQAKDWEKERQIAQRLLDASKSDRERDADRERERARELARDRDDSRDRRDSDRDRDRDRRDGDRGRDREVYFSRPSNAFVLTMGNGYAGRGYYYGPANATYFYERQGVRYYRTREAVPQQYWGNNQSGNFSRTEASVQKALAQRGYYNGPIDGDMGPGSRSAVARYQADNGMKPTGAINDGLLRSLGL